MVIGTESVKNISDQERSRRLQEEEAIREAQRIGNLDNSEKEASNTVGDSYIPSDPVKGIYRPNMDGDGNIKIDYIEPNNEITPKSDKVRNEDSKAEKSDVTTTDTGKVDREIKKLKEEKARLEKELLTAEESGKKELEQRLRQVEAELVQKDNDTYRRQNAVVS